MIDAGEAAQKVDDASIWQWEGKIAWKEWLFGDFGQQFARGECGAFRPTFGGSFRCNMMPQQPSKWRGSDG